MHIIFNLRIGYTKRIIWYAMLNIIWAIMVMMGIAYSITTGNIMEVSDGFLNSAGEAVSLCITMIGVIGFWSGIMEIGKNAGIIDKLTKILNPVIDYLFPNIPKEHKSREYITINMIANILGMGWAATPPGLSAMEELSKLNKDKKTASDEMCTFLIINISSLQLIPINVIAYRAKYGSVNPTAIVFPAIMATFVSTIVGVMFCLLCTKRNKNNNAKHTK